MNDTSHPVAPEEVMSFLDGELSTDRSQFVSSHIEECFDCGKLRDSLGNTSRAFAHWVVPAPPVAAGVKNLLSSSAFCGFLQETFSGRAKPSCLASPAVGTARRFGRPCGARSVGPEQGGA